MKKFMYAFIFIFIITNSVLFNVSYAARIDSTKIKKGKKKRPNIILILSDDMGYSDIHSYGSVNIETPNLDNLAQNGIKYSQFYTTPRCCPSRAALMTGLYPHQTGMGWMDAKDFHLPGYRGTLNNHSVTVAQVLKQSGYSTYMVGKWDLALAANDKPGGSEKNWPRQRGFDKFYGILAGAANYYDPATLMRGNKFISPFNDPEYKPKHYYFTQAISDNAVKFLKEDSNDKPFFMYVAYTTAHWPMQAPDSVIQEYEGDFDAGYEKLREKRLKREKKIGVIKSNAILSPLQTHSWSQEMHKKGMERRMETYAAMVTIMDRGIGKIIAELKKKGIYKNTVILYLQDNGGNAEMIGFGGPQGQTHPLAQDTTNLKPLPKDSINLKVFTPILRNGDIVKQGLDLKAGPADTYVSYLKPWAEVSNTPFKKYKHFVHEGGIATPLIVHWPDGIKNPGQIRRQVGHEIDIMPTLVQLANAKYPHKYQSHSITPEAGVSLIPTFNSDRSLPKRALYWEHEMNRAVRWGKWKLVSPGHLYDGSYAKGWKYYSNEPWELYNLKKDRSEITNLAGQYPKLVKKMADMWKKWAHTHNVFPAPWKKVVPSLNSYYKTDQIKGNVNPLKNGYRLYQKDN
jgi:arylsulfatase